MICSTSTQQNQPSAVAKGSSSYNKYHQPTGSRGVAIAASTGVQSVNVEGAGVAWTNGVLALSIDGVTICAHLLDA